MPLTPLNRRRFLGAGCLATTGLLSAGCTERFGHTQKHFSGIHIGFFAGGPQGGNFSSIVYKGAKSAEQDLGCTVEYVWSDWNTDKMVVQFKKMIDKKPDAICLMGHPGGNVLGPLVDEAQRKDIIVTLQNVDLPKVRGKHFLKGTGYVGQILYSSGLMLTRGALRKFNFVSGDSAIVFGSLNEAGRGERTKGCIDGLEEYGLVVSYVELTEKVKADPYTDIAQRFFSDALKASPEAKLLVVDQGPCTSALPQHLRALGIKPEQLVTIGFDLSIKTIRGIKDGYIGLVHDQQPYLQGYLPILQACLTKKYGFSGLLIDTGSGLVDASNIETISKLVEQQIR